MRRFEKFIVKHVFVAFEELIQFLLLGGFGAVGICLIVVKFLVQVEGEQKRRNTTSCKIKISTVVGGGGRQG